MMTKQDHQQISRKPETEVCSIANVLISTAGHLEICKIAKLRVIFSCLKRGQLQSNTKSYLYLQLDLKPLVAVHT